MDASGTWRKVSVEEPGNRLQEEQGRWRERERATRINPMGPWGLLQIFSQSETVEGWGYCNSLIIHKPVLLSITTIATFIIL